MGIFKDLRSTSDTLRTVRQQGAQVKRPSIRDAIDLKKDPSKAFQAAPDFEKPEDIPESAATATIVAAHPTALYWGNDLLVALSLLVVPDGPVSPYAVAVESGVPESMMERCTGGATVPVSFRDDHPTVVTVDWSS